MPSRKGSALSEFHQSVREATSNEQFNEKFRKLCQRADRHGMIKLLTEIEHVKNVKIGESYRAKNSAEAKKIYDASSSINTESGERGIYLKISFLTKAIFAANSNSFLFAQLLLERARCWYRIGALSRCIKDCDYLIDFATGCPRAAEPKEEILKFNEQRSECQALRVKCTENANRAKKKSQNQCNRNIATSSKLPAIEGKQNSKLKSCSDAVELHRDETRGRHLVASKNIKTGSVLIVDEPFAFSTDFHALATNCLHCHASLRTEDNVIIPCENCQSVSYCSNSCRRDSWDKYHKYECTIFDYFYDEIDGTDKDVAEQQRSHLLLAWRTTIAGAIDRSTNRLDEEFLRYENIENNERTKEESSGANDPYDPLDYRTVLALETHCSDSDIFVTLTRSLRAVFLAKCLDTVLSKMQSSRDETMAENDLITVAVAMLRHMQAVDCNAYEIVENWRDEGTKIWEPRNVGGAIYSTVSLVNHGCYPNVVRHSYPGGKVVVRALRFIAKGMEILDCYGPHFLSDNCSTRRRYLSDKYHFSCACVACANDWQLPDDRLTAYKCSSCETSVPIGDSRCPKCSRVTEAKKLEAHLAKSTKKRIHAIARMFEGNYADALPKLLEHAALVDKMLAVPSLEAIKTQQSIVQCYNSLGSTCPSDRTANSTCNREK